METIKYLSLFSGIGGFELGIGEKGECIGYAEVDKYAIQIYEQHFNHRAFGDVTQIDAKTLPDFELLVGGFPCQAFSIAGKRRGFEDTRGTLFFEIARIVSEKRPRLLLLENVKGLLSHNEGRTYATILATLDELGYDLQWQVLNSKNFGVPQNRERVFIVGHLRDTRRPEVFPLGEDSEADNVVPTLTARYYRSQTNGAYLRQVTPKGRSQGERVYDPAGIATTIASQSGGLETKTGLYMLTENERRGKIKAVLTPNRINKKQNGRRMKEAGEPMFTLTGQDIHGIYDGTKIRRLTPTECERLQGFPDGWTDGISDSQRYKCLGNAVTVNVVRAIFNKLLEEVNDEVYILRKR